MDNFPIPENEKQRLAALKKYQILNSLSEEEYDRITSLASLICGVPISLITLIDEHRQWFKSKKGIDIDEIPRTLTFCQYTIMGDDIMEVTDATLDERLKDHAMVTEERHIRFYAGYPLIDPDGYNVGTLCVADTKVKKLSADQKEALRLLSKEAMQLILERRLKEELRNFEKIFIFSDDLISVSDTNGNFLKANPAFQKLLGWTEAEMVHKTLFDLIHPTDYTIVNAEMSKLKQGNTMVNFEHRMLTATGDYKLFQWTATPEKGTNNLFAIGRDITRLKANEEKLAEKEADLRAIFINSHGFLCTHDLDGNFIAINSAGAAILGYTIDEIVTMSLYDVIPEDRYQNLTSYLAHIKKSGRASGQMLVNTKDGLSRTLMFNNVIESRHGKTPYVIGNAMDITERKAIEQRLFQVTEMLELTNHVARVGGWRMDIASGQIDWTAVTREIHEIPDDFEISLATALNFFEDVATRESVVNAVNLAIETGQSYELELQLVTYTGKQIWVKAMGNAIFEDGVCKRLYGSFQDIDKRKKSELELNIAKIAAEQASIAKSGFLANMSHEIRTPLNGVIGFTDLVLKTELNDSQTQYLSIVNQSAVGLLGIINDILDFSKIEAGKLELDIEECDIYEISGQATDIITYQVQNKGLELLLNLSSDLPRFIWSDALRLKQIMVNLLGNAAKFTEHGEIELKIQVLKQIGQKSLIRFSVRDTGIGIQEANKEKIFEAFAQEEGSTAKKYGGTGLGLSITNKLLGMMDSKLKLVSTIGKGSQFYFDVWLRSRHGKSKEWKGISWIKKVLVVDDNENNRLIIEQMLLLKNIVTVQAKSGKEALKLLGTGQKFDIILMDYHMPEMDGLDTIRQIRKNNTDTDVLQPVILLFSSADDETIINACEELQVNSRLVKPVKMDRLYDTLSRIHLKSNSVNPIKKASSTSITDQEIVIMIADDNPVNLLLAKTIIRRAATNAVIIEAENGVEAVNQFKKTVPDLILMDVQMPEMNGYEATIAIRKLEQFNNRVPIIALTAGNVKNERNNCIAAGMDDFVVKPIIENTIIQVLKKWLYINAEVNIEEVAINDAELLHFDLNVLKSHIGDDPEVIAEILMLTKAQLSKVVVILKTAVEEDQLSVLQAEGHKLYGTSVSAGLPRLAKLARQLEYLNAEDELTAADLNLFVAQEIKICLGLI